MPYELPDALARAGPKHGEPGRNPEGFCNLPLRRKHEALARMLRAEATAPCEIAGYEHLTKWEYAMSVVMDLAMTGDKWAVTWCANRLFGRVPVQMDVDVQHHAPDLAELSNEELAARLDSLRDALRAPESEAVEGQVVVD